MPKKRFQPEEIIGKLRHADVLRFTLREDLKTLTPDSASCISSFTTCFRLVERAPWAAWPPRSA